MSYLAILIGRHQTEEVEKKLYSKSFQKWNVILTNAIGGDWVFLIKQSIVDLHPAEMF